MNVRDYLRQHNVGYELIRHEPSYDAQHLAQAVATAGREVAKTVLLVADGKWLLAIVPAPESVDLERVREILDVDNVRLATESEVASCFPDCERGAIPPFGSAYNMDTLMDEDLAANAEITFEGNAHDEAVRMNMSDFLVVEAPTIMHLAYSYRYE